MGKRIISRRRGRGGRYKSNSHRYRACVKYDFGEEFSKNKHLVGRIVDFVHCPGHNTPLVKVDFVGKECFLFACCGMRQGDKIYVGKSASLNDGNVLFLGDIPEGTSICNIEGIPGDGGKYIRSSGVFGKVISKIGNRVVVKMPSKKQREFSKNCLATLGSLAGGGRLKKPFVKAGNRFHIMKARGRLYPITSAVSMNAVNHPFGSGRGSHIGKPKTVSRHAPPGRKVGLIAARRTGKKR